MIQSCLGFIQACPGPAWDVGHNPMTLTAEPLHSMKFDIILYVGPLDLEDLETSPLFVQRLNKASTP